MLLMWADERWQQKSTARSKQQQQQQHKLDGKSIWDMIFADFLLVLFAIMEWRAMGLASNFKRERRRSNNKKG